MKAPAVVDQLTVLSDAIRVRMLAVLESRELTVSELCDVVQLPQSTVSRHLKTLLDGGWVTSRRDGTRRLYTLPLDDVDPAAKRLWQVVREQAASSATLTHDERRLKQVLARRRSQSEAFFSSSAGHWDRLREELFGPASHLRALVGLLDPHLVVGDLGCGTGIVTQCLSPFCERIIAIDASKEMLDAARETVGDQDHIGFRQGSLEKLPIDALEVFNAATTLRRYNRYAFRYAHVRGLPMTAASDAHHHAAIGTAYTILNTEDFSVRGILAQIVKSNELNQEYLTPKDSVRKTWNNWMRLRRRKNGGDFG